MDRAAFERGLQIRREVFRPESLNQALSTADDFDRPLQDLITQYCFGEIWASPVLDRRTRSMITLAMLSALNRPNQIRAHVRGAINNGVTKDELRDLFLQVAIYCGVPAGVDSFRVAREVFQEMGI
jgi:4-carboxymuconolactone decarboxylase